MFDVEYPLQVIWYCLGLMLEFTHFLSGRYSGRWKSSKSVDFLPRKREETAFADTEMFIEKIASHNSTVSRHHTFRPSSLFILTPANDAIGLSTFRRRTHHDRTGDNPFLPTKGSNRSRRREFENEKLEKAGFFSLPWWITPISLPGMHFALILSGWSQLSSRKNG